MARWKCVCREWVDTEHPSHTHAFIHARYDEAMKQWIKTLGLPHSIETYERKPTDDRIETVCELVERAERYLDLNAAESGADVLIRDLVDAIKLPAKKMTDGYNLLRDAVAWFDSHQIESKLGHLPQWVDSVRKLS